MFEDGNPVADLEYFKCKNEKDLQDLKQKYKIKANVKIISDKDLWREKFTKTFPETENDTFLRVF